METKIDQSMRTGSGRGHHGAVRILRWIARIWSLVVLVVALLIVILPDRYAVYPVPLSDWVLLSFYWIAILGLLIAWRWEALGGALAIAAVFGRSVAFYFIRGVWPFDLSSMSILAVVFVLLGILYLVCWRMSRHHHSEVPPEYKPVSTGGK
ncbi:MAG: hypothetical protein NTU59_02480 [Coprothermobacterota bacterium]|nr:hypothetical protein [Coprothermobacterota bacterium]